MRWFRFYDDVLNDPKVQQLPCEMFKAWVNILCIASKHGGTIPECNVSFLLRLTEDETKSLLQSLVDAGLIDRKNGKLMPHGWNKRQYKSDSSTERVKRFRNAKVTPTATPPEADTEQIQNKPPNPLRGEFEEFWKAYPRKVARGSASRAFAKAVKKASPATIIEAVKLFASVCAGREPEFIPHAATWLNAERWSDAELKPTLSVVSIRSPQPSETREEYIRRLAAMSRA
jgi:hypothetical protein